MTDDMSTLIQRIVQLEARVYQLEQPKPRRKHSPKSTAGNIDLGDDLFPTIPSTAPARANTGKDEVSFGAVDLGVLD